MLILSCSRPVWKLDRNCIRHPVWLGACDCSASRNRGSWSTAISNIYRASKSRDQSETLRRILDFSVQWIQSCAHMACATVPWNDIHAAWINAGGFVQGEHSVWLEANNRQWLNILIWLIVADCFIGGHGHHIQLLGGQWIWPVRRTRRPASIRTKSSARHRSVVRSAGIERKSCLCN